jgi:large subunit ribosomal protein L15
MNKKIEIEKSLDQKETRRNRFLSELESLGNKPKTRLGRGKGSGTGKTAGRGLKGQKARSKVPVQLKGLQDLRKMPKRGFISIKKDDTYELSLLDLARIITNTGKKEISTTDLLLLQNAPKRFKKLKIIANTAECDCDFSGVTVKVDYASKSSQETLEKQKGKIEFLPGPKKFIRRKYIAPTK